MRNLLFTLFIGLLIGCSNKTEEFPGTIILFPNPFETNLSIEMELESESQVEIYLYRKREDNAQIGVIPEDFDENKNPLIEGTFQAGRNSLILSFENRGSGVYIMDFVVGGLGKRFQVIKQ